MYGSDPVQRTAGRKAQSLLLCMLCLILPTQPSHPQVAFPPAVNIPRHQTAARPAADLRYPDGGEDQTGSTAAHPVEQRHRYPEPAQTRGVPGPGFAAPVRLPATPAAELTGKTQGAPVPRADPLIVPHFCQRHLVVQQILLKAVADATQRTRACETVTAADLATVTALTLEVGVGHAPLQPRDFAGLPHLTRLELVAPNIVLALWPKDLLVDTPDLQELRLTFYHVLIPLPLIQNLPHLASVPHYDYGAVKQDLPVGRLADLLEHLPALRYVTFDLTDVKTLPTQLLAHNSQLHGLTLFNQHTVPSGPYGPFLDPDDLMRLPPDLLHYTPALKHLEVSGITGPLPAGLLDHVPAFRKLAVRGLVHPSSLPDRLLAHNAHLESLTLHMWSNYFKWTSHNAELPADLLAYTPRLLALDLQSDQFKLLPADLLAPVPWLQKLTLVPPLYSFALPAELLSNSAYLQELLMATGGKLPDLSHNPLLRTLDFARLPSTPLARLPLLEELRIHVSGLDPGAAETLGRNPHLRVLKITWLNTLPPNFLAHNPALQSLQIGDLHIAPDELPRELLAHEHQIDTLRIHMRFSANMGHSDLLADFLRYTPQLQNFELKLVSQEAYLTSKVLANSLQLRKFKLQASLQALPEDFLWRNEQLQDLELRSDYLTSLPARLLHNSPRLQHLALSTPALASLPDDLLAAVPHLQKLYLYSEKLPALPSSLLAHNPQLRELTLQVPTLTSMPKDLLHYAPRLQHLTLNTHGSSGVYGLLQTLPEDFLCCNPELQNLRVILYNTPRTLPPTLLVNMHWPHLRELVIIPADPHLVVPPDLLAKSPYLRVVTVYNGPGP